MNFADLLSQSAVVGGIGLVIFIVVLRYSNKIFEWIEIQTFGTRNHLLEQFERLFIDVKPDHVTYSLLGLSFGVGIITLLVCGLFSKWIMGVTLGIILGFIGWKVPKPFIKMMIDKRIKQYQGQMIDGLTLLSNGIRAGLSVPQALAMVVSEMPAPISQEFNIILQQNRVGVTLEEAFENLTKRIPTEDNDMFVSSVNILRETGGNLAETFDTIVDVIRERIRLQQKIDTYIAQGMIQAYTIGAMPFLIGIMFFGSSRAGFTGALSNPLSLALIVASIVLDAIGMAIIKKIVAIKV